MNDEIKYDSKADTLEHICNVRNFINIVVCEVLKRGELHDKSKLIEDEKIAFDIASPKLKTLTFGTQEYKDSLDSIKPSLELHYKRNSHHPEHYSNGIDDMNLIDIIEMLCDWKASSLRQKQKTVNLDFCKERFNMSEQLYKIFKNTLVILEKID